LLDPNTTPTPNPKPTYTGDLRVNNLEGFGEFGATGTSHIAIVI